MSINFKNLKITSDTKYESDGYGGELSWTYYFLHYQDKSMKLHYWNDDCNVTSKDVESLLDIKFDLKMYKKLFRENPDIYYMLSDVSLVIHTEVVKSCNKKSDLEKLAQLKESITKDINEYNELRNKVYKEKYRNSIVLWR